MMVKKIVLLPMFVLAASCTVETGETESVSRVRSPARDERPIVLFLGTSLTAGLGLAENQAYPAIIQSRLDSLHYDYRVVNAGVSGETSAGGLRRINWLLRAPVSILVLELGANDGLRGQDVRGMKTNLLAIIDGTREAYPDVKTIVVGMEAPPNFGLEYTRSFRAVFREIALEKNAALVPFLLEGVAGIDSLNQADGMHPTRQGHEILADNVWKVLEQVIN